MAIQIDGIAGSVKMHVTGDLETVLTVPHDEDERFLVALSDGTLLLGTCDENLAYTWSVARNGAGIVHVAMGSVTIEWNVEWVTISVYDPNVIEPELSDTLLVSSEDLPCMPALGRYRNGQYDLAAIRPAR